MLLAALRRNIPEKGTYFGKIKKAVSRRDQAQIAKEVQLLPLLGDAGLRVFKQEAHDYAGNRKRNYR
jgi:hypothetical protein